MRTGQLDARLEELERLLAGIAPSAPDDAAHARWRADLAATRFHLRDANAARPILLVVLGGTGTGKSTLVNRLLRADLSATSFRRTFTSGALAIARDQRSVPASWLGVEHQTVAADTLPARGQADKLLVIDANSPITQKVTLVDTPDLDGDQPAHHAQADRAFRWAQAVLFLVTPEKYQMTELPPYYRLARRYALPAIYVMNKCDDDAARRDWAQQLSDTGIAEAPNVYAVPRDDAAYEPPADANLDALRRALLLIQPASDEAREQGLRHRTADLMDRFVDQILLPMQSARQQARRLIAMLRAMTAPAAAVDVNPVTQQLQRRMQERSVLYLMGPQRILDRVRQAPAMLARLPRTAWDWIIKGPDTAGASSQAMGLPPDGGDRRVPDFRAILVDQMTIVQSRIDDAIRAAPQTAAWMERDAAGYTAAKIDPARAGDIAEQEIGELRTWLEQRWNASPRDTAILQKLLKHLPGGEKLTQWSEAAPYLLAIVVATHHMFFGPVDLLILGGYTLTTWAIEKLSNEVAARTRSANRRIADRFTKLADEQINSMVRWLDRQAPGEDDLRRLERAANNVSEMIT